MQNLMAVALQTDNNSIVEQRKAADAETAWNKVRCFDNSETR